MFYTVSVNSLRVLSLGLVLLFAGGIVLQPVTVHAEAKVRVKKKAKPKAKAKAKKKKKKAVAAESQYKIRVDEGPRTYKFDANGRPIAPKGKANRAEPKKTSSPDEIDGIVPADDAKSCADGAACNGS